MSDFKSRLSIEKSELDEKIEKLSMFLNSDAVKNIDPKQQDLLADQLPAMASYSDILSQRIALLA